MDNATGLLPAEKLLFTLEDNEIPLSRLQSHGSDVSNCNKTVWNK